MDQELAVLRDTLPRVYWAIYQGSLQVGFDTKQAMAVLTAYILSQNPNGIRPDTPTGKPLDN